MAMTVATTREESSVMTPPLLMTSDMRKSTNPLAQQTSPVYRTPYREIPERAFETDALVQLKANISQLEDLHGRMKFMMSELSYLLRRA